MKKIYTDGSCFKNGKNNVLAGWSYVVIDENDKLFHTANGSIENGTNNIGELMAIKRALEYIRENDNDTYQILSDSAYCVNGISEWRHNWKKANWTRMGKILKNRQLWIDIDALIEEIPCSHFFITHIRGHANNKWNDLADKLAKGAINE